MDKTNLKNKPCAWATPKPDGYLFWENGTYVGEDEQSYFFLISGKLRAYSKSNILRLEFNASQIGVG